jgi:hypothetical protein
MRVLAVADEPITGEDLRSALNDEQIHDAEVMIIVPPCSLTIRFLMSDADEAIANAMLLGQADARLGHGEEILMSTTDSAVGDIAATIADALVMFRADRVLLFVARSGGSRPAERIDTEALEFELGIPVELVALTSRGRDAQLNGRWSHARL